MNQHSFVFRRPHPLAVALAFVALCGLVVLLVTVGAVVIAIGLAVGAISSLGYWIRNKLLGKPERRGPIVLEGEYRRIDRDHY